MAWLGMGRGNRGAKPERVRQFEPADPVIVNAFADLQQVRYLKCNLQYNQFPQISPRAVERFERQAWDRLIRYLVKLPLPSDN